MKRIYELRALFYEFNEAVFCDKLTPITLLIKRNQSKDGWYEYRTEARKGDLWMPSRRDLCRAAIVVNEGCWPEGTVEATLLHEMIHQYQTEVLDAPPHHDVVFKSIARKMERDYHLPVR